MKERNIKLSLETEDGKIITHSEADGYKFIEPKFKVGDWITIKQ